MDSSSRTEATLSDAFLHVFGIVKAIRYFTRRSR